MKTVKCVRVSYRLKPNKAISKITPVYDNTRTTKSDIPRQLNQRFHSQSSQSPTSNSDVKLSSRNTFMLSTTHLSKIIFVVVVGMASILSLTIATYALVSIFITVGKDTTTDTTTTTTTQTPIVNITQIGDPVVGICGTFAGGSSGGIGVNYNGAESPSKAIDGLISTKYYNSASSTSGCPASNPGGINTGFFVTPTLSNSSIAVAILFITGNDHPNRDPITMTLEGSNETNTLNLHMGTSWTLIYNGSTGFNVSYDPGRHAYGTQQNFSNTMSFASYRLLSTSRRGVDNGVQYSEVQILGYL